MKQLHHFKPFLSAAVIALASLPVHAQSTAVPPAPGASASMSMDCANHAAKRHDHGAERGMPATAQAMPCAADAAASASTAKSKKRRSHDHAKFHKNT